MFENLLGNLKQKFQESQQRKELEKAELARMQREVDFQKKQIFEDQFKKDALEVAKAQAKKEAAELSGLKKMRAQNRLRNLNKTGLDNPANMFSKLAAYTQKNIARREENLKRTQDMRDAGKKMVGEKGVIVPGIRKPFQPSGFGNRRNG